ncbi:MAG: M15 family metallopeptidase [Spirochaetaceae bacterium]|jgi:D-alanyl-D-alanine carboxypeptidase|nr:M15 family metallopeptidase [Spirochaetaceae bacterium]
MNRKKTTERLLCVSFLCCALAAVALSCAKRGGAAEAYAAYREEEAFMSAEAAEDGMALAFSRFLDGVIAAAELPPETARVIREAAGAGPPFILEILTCLNGEIPLHVLVDKSHPLGEGYAPDDLVELGGPGAPYHVTRRGMTLRAAAARALHEMAREAERDGLTLTVGSAYRSYDYQVEVYGRIVREMGVEAADRESARPGYSQHQTGLAVDFSPIDDRFADTPEGRWVRDNAERFGWSVSFPEGGADITGYRAESWHYRYLGRDLAAFTAAYFGGIQQYALRFLHEWEQAEQE